MQRVKCQWGHSLLMHINISCPETPFKCFNVAFFWHYITQHKSHVLFFLFAFVQRLAVRLCSFMGRNGILVHYPGNNPAREH